MISAITAWLQINLAIAAFIILSQDMFIKICKGPGWCTMGLYHSGCDCRIQIQKSLKKILDFIRSNKWKNPRPSTSDTAVTRYTDLSCLSNSHLLTGFSFVVALFSSILSPVTVLGAHMASYWSSLADSYLPSNFRKSWGSCSPFGVLCVSVNIWAFSSTGLRQCPWA